MMALIFTLVLHHANCEKKNLRVLQKVTLQDEGYVGY